MLYSDEITLVALGPLTNLALAMRLDDQFASNLKELYIMGGNVEGNIHSFEMPNFNVLNADLKLPGIGNITVSAEFNFHCDPEAAYVVLQNIKCPTYIASWELCLHRAKLDWVPLFFFFLNEIICIFGVLTLIECLGLEDQ